ncbi:unnamed protein product, partial [Trichogramma brassicae]
MSHTRRLYVLAGIPPLALLAGRANAALRPPPGETQKHKNAWQTLSKWQEAWDQSTKARWDASADPEYQSVDREETRRVKLPHLTQLLTGMASSTINDSAQCPVSSLIQSRTRSTYSITCP